MNDCFLPVLWKKWNQINCWLFSGVYLCFLQVIVASSFFFFFPTYCIFWTKLLSSHLMTFYSFVVTFLIVTRDYEFQQQCNREKTTGTNTEKGGFNCILREALLIWLQKVTRCSVETENTMQMCLQLLVSRFVSVFLSVILPVIHV